MTIGTKAVIGLAAGLAAGAAIASTGQATLTAAGSAIELVGKLWINAILMTIVPLVVSKLIASIAGQDDPRVFGRAGVRAAALFLALLVAAALISAVVIPVAFRYMPVNASVSTSLGTRPAGTGGVTPPTLAQSVLGLVPSNAIRAAAEGAIVPLLVFSVAFALGASRIPRTLRDPLVALFRSIDAAITVLLHWIVALAPYGVFALGLGLAMRAGGGVAASLAYYVIVSSAALFLFTAALYLLVFVLAGVTPAKFARAAAPAQVVAFGTHSSMASLPAMIEGAEVRLGLSGTAVGFVLPLALAVFKYSGPIWFITVAHFVGRLYGVPIDPSRTVPIVLASVLTSFAIGGVPSGAAVVAAPVLVAAGLPAEAMGVVLAVDPLPNAFRTVANVTGMLAVTVVSDGRAKPGPG